MVFSKDTIKDPFYRDIAREAVQIYNHALQVITGGKVRVEMAKEGEEDKDLGDPRYNVLNLTSPLEINPNGLLGIAPSYVNPNTGQIIGTTVNVFLSQILLGRHEEVKSYIRYEIFQKDRKSTKDNDIHVVSPYIKSKIVNRCSPSIQDIIKNRRDQFLAGKLKPNQPINDKDISIPCAEKISREEILHTILHEMGHSFGLAHNFEASTDKDYYYKSPEEMKEYFPLAKMSLIDSQELPESSSVMDYVPLHFSSLPVLGKYDMAALRFLYMDQVEKKKPNQKEPFLSLEIPNEPSQQKPLSEAIISQKKNYLHCSYSEIGNPRSLCRMFDYGSTPEAITKFKILEIERNFNRLRYRYDTFTAPWEYLSNDPRKVRGYYYWWIDNRLMGPIFSVVNLYNYWLKLRNQYLLNGEKQKARYIIPEDKRLIESHIVKEYQNTIKGNLDNTEYNLYYQVREPVFNFFMNFLFLETMKCEVEDEDNEKKRYFFDLELIKRNLLSGGKETTEGQFIEGQTTEGQLYIVDCYSQAVKDFFKNEGLDVIGQKGMEHFEDHSYNSDPSLRREDVLALGSILNSFNRGFPGKTNKIFFGLAEEPDFMENFRIKLEEHIFHKDYLSKVDLERIKQLYNMFTSAVNTKLKRNNNDISVSHETEKYWTSVVYSVRTGTGSFYELVEKPLKEKSRTIEEINVPFLIPVYQQYLDSAMNEQMNFLAYVANKDETIKTEKKLIIPFQQGSLVERMILKYNENLKVIRELDELERKEGALTFLEATERERKKEQNEVLYDMI